MLGLKAMRGACACAIISQFNRCFTVEKEFCFESVPRLSCYVVESVGIVSFVWNTRRFEFPNRQMSQITPLYSTATSLPSKQKESLDSISHISLISRVVLLWQRASTCKTSTKFSKSAVINRNRRSKIRLARKFNRDSPKKIAGNATAESQ
jgi:hypothetical protein